MEALGQSQTLWHAILGQIFRPEMLAFFPDKVFLVEKNGTYHDCFYPLPCLHLLNGHSVIGQTMREIFSLATWQHLKRSCREVERTRRYKEMWIQSARPASPIHQTHLTILTLESRFLLFAKDYTAAGLPLLNFQLDSPPMNILRKQLWPFLPATPEDGSARTDQTATDR